jgi:ribosomal protein S18 acetylase RimI-like enzyme
MTFLSKNPPIKIRRAKPKDAAQIAKLSGQLGYPTTTTEMRKRLPLVLRDKRAACFVAETDEAGVIGWIHVSVCPLLEVEGRVEVNGLIVDEQTRSGGAGWRLLLAAEKWTLKMKCKSVSVRSNVIRERAHAFYLKHGYEHYKTQKAFRKSI